jgi:hypothetical protein
MIIIVWGLLSDVVAEQTFFPTQVENRVLFRELFIFVCNN